MHGYPPISETNSFDSQQAHQAGLCSQCPSVSAHASIPAVDFALLSGEHQEGAPLLQLQHLALVWMDFLPPCQDTFSAANLPLQHCIPANFSVAELQGPSLKHPVKALQGV